MHVRSEEQEVKQQEEKTRDASTQTELEVYRPSRPKLHLSELQLKRLQELSKESAKKPIEKPKSKLGLAAARMFENLSYKWSSNEPMPDSRKEYYNEREKLLKESESQTQKPVSSSTSISSALAEAEKVKAPVPQNMDAPSKTEAKSTRCETVRHYLSDLYFIGYAGGAAATILPVLTGYAAYRAQGACGSEKDNYLSCILLCLAEICAAPGGTAGVCTTVPLGLFGAPCVAIANKEPQFVKDMAEPAKHLLGVSY